MRGERGEKGDHGQTGERGAEGRRSWATPVAIILFSLVMIAGFAFSKAQADRAIRDSRTKIESESRRADRGICVIAQSNRERIIAGTEGLLSLIRNPVPNETPERAAARLNAVHVLEAQLADARSPFPAPCTAYSL